MSCLNSSLSCEQREVSEHFKMKIYAPPGIEPSALAFQRVALTTRLPGQLTCVETFTLFLMLLSINTCGNECMKLILVRRVLELIVRQNLHFFYQ